MTTLSGSALTALRSEHPHAAKLYLSVLNPALVASGVVTGTPVLGARQITLGSILHSEKFLPGFTALVVAPSGTVISKRRVRSLSGTTLTVDENSVAWAAGQTIMVYENWELWSVYPYIETTSPFTFYKDRDIAYTDQNTQIPPVAIAGTPRAGFCDGSLLFRLDGTLSYAMAAGASIVSYAWTCTGGTVLYATSAVAEVGFITGDEGQYWVTLTVTDSNGKTGVTHRPIWVHSRTGVHAPISNFIIDSINANAASGGYDTRIIVRDQYNYPNNAMIVLWDETYFKGVEKELRSTGNIRFVGYVTDQKVTKNKSTDEVEITVKSITGYMDSMKMFSVSMQEDDPVDAWYKFPKDTLTAARIAHHFWKWHSTLFEVTDVFLPTDNTITTSACDDIQNGTLFSGLKFLYQNGIFARVCSNRAGQVFLAQDILMLEDDERAALDVFMEITDADRSGEGDLEYIRNEGLSTSSVEASGIGKNAKGEYVPLLSIAPGPVPENYGAATAVFERLMLRDQAHLNFLSGRLLAAANNDPYEIRLSFHGDYPIDLMPQSWFYMLIDAYYTKRNRRIARNMALQSFTEHIDIISGVITQECVFTSDFQSQDGVPEDYPVVPDPSPDPLPPYVPPDWVPPDWVPYIPPIPIKPDPPPPPSPYIPPNWWPTVLPDCTEGADAQNGPFDLWVAGSIDSTQADPSVVAWMKGAGIQAGDHPTAVTIDGCLQKSEDCGETWEDWDGTGDSAPTLEAVGVDGAPTGITAPMTGGPSGGGCGEFTFTFQNPSTGALGGFKLSMPTVLKDDMAIYDGFTIIYGSWSGSQAAGHGWLNMHVSFAAAGSSNAWLVGTATNCMSCTNIDGAHKLIATMNSSECAEDGSPSVWTNSSGIADRVLGKWYVGGPKLAYDIDEETWNNICTHFFGDWAPGEQAGSVLDGATASYGCVKHANWNVEEAAAGQSALIFQGCPTLYRFVIRGISASNVCAG